MKYILTAVLLVSITLVSAQTISKKQHYKAAITISPIALLDIDNGVMIGGEYRFTSQFTFSLDAAYLFSSYYFSDIKKTKGFNLRPAFRYYLPNKDQNEFVQLQAFYKKVDYTLYGWLDKNVVNNVPSYSQLQEFDYYKDVWGINLMVGQLDLFSTNRFFIDVATGFGVRVKKEGVTELNSRIRPSGWQIGVERKEKQTTISMPLSAKLAYRI
jgi:hypothetical protein